MDNLELNYLLPGLHILFFFPNNAWLCLWSFFSTNQINNQTKQEELICFQTWIVYSKFYLWSHLNYWICTDNNSLCFFQSLSLDPIAHNFRSLRRSIGVQAVAEHTAIELTGRDRPRLLSEVFAVLADLKCNVVAAEVWIHNSRMVSVVYITHEATGLSIDNPDCLAKIK